MSEFAVSYYLGRFLEGGLFGIYSGLFAIHLACHAAKRETDSSSPNIIFYALCLLYVLTAALFAIDIGITLADIKVTYGFDIAETTIFGCCDFIAQCILIHRCWIVYSQDIRVIIVPSILAFAYLVLWVAAGGSFLIAPDDVDQFAWGNILSLTALIASMIVNAVVTGLIVFRIFKVFLQVGKRVTSLEHKTLGGTPGNKLRSVIFIIIESGMALFAVQLARVIISIGIITVLTSNAAYYAFEYIVAIHGMVNGMAPTIILVRVSLGLSFYDKESLVDAVGSLQFAADSISEEGSIDQDESSHIGHDDDLSSLPVMGNTNLEKRDDETGGSDDIQIVLDK